MHLPTTIRSTVTIAVLTAVLLPGLAVHAGAEDRPAPAVPPPAVSLRDSGLAPAAAPAARLRTLGLLFPRTPVRAPVVARLPARQPVHVPGWIRTAPAPQLDVPTGPTTIQHGAFRAGTHVSHPYATHQVRRFDQQATAWARELISTARVRTTLLPLTVRPRLTPQLRSELQRLSLDYINGLYCGWLQGAALGGVPRPGDPSTSEQAFRDAVVLRMSAALRLAMVGQLYVYKQTLDGLRKDLARTTRLDGMVMDPMGTVVTSALLGFALSADPALTRAVGSHLTKGMVAWYRACYAPPLR